MATYAANSGSDDGSCAMSISSASDMSNNSESCSMSISSGSEPTTRPTYKVILYVSSIDHNNTFTSTYRGGIKDVNDANNIAFTVAMGYMRTRPDWIVQVRNVTEAGMCFVVTELQNRTQGWVWTQVKEEEWSKGGRIWY